MASSYLSANITRQGLLKYGKAVGKDLLFEGITQLAHTGGDPDFWKEMDLFDIVTTGRNSRFILLSVLAGSIDVKANGDWSIVGAEYMGHAEHHKGYMKTLIDIGLNAGTGRVVDKPNVPFGKQAGAEIMSGYLSEKMEGFTF